MILSTASYKKASLALAAGVLGVGFLATGVLAKSKTESAFNDGLFNPYDLGNPSSLYQYEGIQAGGQLGYNTGAYEYEGKGSAQTNEVTADFSQTSVSASGSVNIKGFVARLDATGADENADLKVKQGDQSAKSSYNLSHHLLDLKLGYTIGKNFTLALGNSYHMKRDGGSTTHEQSTTNTQKFGFIFHNKMLEAGAHYQFENDDSDTPSIISTNVRVLLGPAELGLGIEKTSYSQLSSNKAETTTGKVDTAEDQVSTALTAAFRINQKMKVGLLLAINPSYYTEDEYMNFASMGSNTYGLAFTGAFSKSVTFNATTFIASGSGDYKEGSGTSATNHDYSASIFGILLGVTAAI